MTNRTNSATPGFALLDDDDQALAPTVAQAPAPQVAPEPPQPQAAQPAAPARPVRQTPPMNDATPRAYVQPVLGGVLPLAENVRSDLDVRSTDTALVTEATPAAAPGVSKVKLAITGACLVAAVAIGMTMFGHSLAPTVATVATTAAPTALPAAAPTTVTRTAVDAGQAAPTVGIDVGSTQAIPLDTGGDIDMIEQWAPVPPAEQSCTSQALSPYLQHVCAKVTTERYYKCSPDGFHWDPRQPGCAAL